MTRARRTYGVTSILRGADAQDSHHVAALHLVLAWPLRRDDADADAANAAMYAESIMLPSSFASFAYV